MIVPSFSSVRYGMKAVGSDLSHVTEAGDVGPVAGEDSTGGGVLLALEDDSHSCALEAEVDSADT